MDPILLEMVEVEEKRGREKWGEVDRSPGVLLNAATEELGEVAHAINHEEGRERINQEIADLMGIMSRLFTMINAPVSAK